MLNLGCMTILMGVTIQHFNLAIQQLITATMTGAEVLLFATLPYSSLFLPNIMVKKKKMLELSIQKTLTSVSSQ
jgi:hypothetical protein